MNSFPHKLKLGKNSGRYDLSQDIYVLTVTVGETPFIQCTLTSASPASQCIEYISQKMQLGQVDMFGLRFQMRSNDPDERTMRWVELDKPLRKQLDKWACKPWERKVQLAVLYHTPNAFTLSDQMARSYYFLMMKLDIVEGRMAVDLDKQITLAAYSLQVECGDYDEQVHDLQSVQGLPLLPKHICCGAVGLDDLLQRVLLVYQSMKGKCPRDSAAILYIIDAIQSEGYGEEYFKGKDEDSSEVKVGYAPEGIIVKDGYNAPLIMKWGDIRDITACKRKLLIRMKDDREVFIVMETAEWCRYVVMLFNWQFRYSMSKAIDETNAGVNITNLQGEIKTPVPHASSSSHLAQSTNELNFIGKSSSIGNSSESIIRLDRVHTDKMKSPLSSVSFRHPPTIPTLEERVRAASTAACPVGSSSIINQRGMGMAYGRGHGGQNASTSSSSPWPSTFLHTANNSSHQQPRLPYTSGHAGIARSEMHMTHAGTSSEAYGKTHVGSTPEMRVLGVSTSNYAPMYSSTSVASSSIPSEPMQHESTSSTTATSSAPGSNGRQYIPVEMFQSVPNLRVRSTTHSTTPSVDDCRLSRHIHVDSLIVSGRALSDRQHNRVKSPDTSDHVHLQRAQSAPRVVKESLEEHEIEEGEEEDREGQERIGVKRNGHFQQRPHTQRRMTVKPATDEENIALLQALLLGEGSDSIASQFSKIPNRRMSAGTSTSLLPENTARNRTRSIVPYEGNRVTLRPHKSNPTGYINASHVDVPIGSRRLHYILAQAPLKDTVDDFWAAVWEQNVQVIVMLAEPKLDLSSNAPIYWPTNSSAKVETREVVVRFRTIQQSGHEVTTTLEVRNRTGGERRTVYHVRFDGWPSGQCPASEHELLSFMDSVRTLHRHVEHERVRRADSVYAEGKHSRQPSTNNLADVSNIIRSPSSDNWSKRIAGSSTTSTHSHQSSVSSTSSTDSGAPPSPASAAGHSPLLIHCHNGSHEAGVYLLAEVVIQCIQHNAPFSIAEMLNNLRAQRMSLVKTEEQYRFVHAIVLASLQQSRLI